MDRTDSAGEGAASHRYTPLFLLFFVYTASDVPAVNEAHYLTKAKHYWNPQWCQRDLFLASADAHVVFYWSVGWLTRYFTLPQSAWIGRKSSSPTGRCCRGVQVKKS